ETPTTIEQLDLMKRLYKYAQGKAKWHKGKDKLGPKTKQACSNLYHNLIQLTEIIAPILDRATAREMRTFTIHDRTHGQKVAHLMWHILKPECRERLTPPEIALMVLAAYIHDLGMALTDEERKIRLNDEELWFKLELNENQKLAYQKL